MLSTLSPVFELATFQAVPQENLYMHLFSPPNGLRAQVTVTENNNKSKTTRTETIIREKEIEQK
jgi:hypothetical protein